MTSYEKIVKMGELLLEFGKLTEDFIRTSPTDVSILAARTKVQNEMFNLLTD